MISGKNLFDIIYTSHYEKFLHFELASKIGIAEYLADYIITNWKN